MNCVDQLTARLLDVGLTDAEWDELDRLLAADPLAAEQHLSLLELEAVLRGLRTDFDLSTPTLAKLSESQAERTTRAVLAEIASRPAPGWWSQSGAAAAHLAAPLPAAACTPAPAGGRASGHPSRPPRRDRTLWVSAAVLFTTAAALIVGIWVEFGLPPQPAAPPTVAAPESSPAVARVTRAVGAVELLTPNGESQPVGEGGPVPAGHTLRTVGEESLARVELPDHSLLDLEADTVVRFESLDGPPTQKPRLFLATGQLTAAVSERPVDRPLVVATGVADVLGRAGIFVVTSASPASAHIDIRKGHVEVVRRAEPKPLPLNRGSAFLHAELAKVWFEPSLVVERTPARSLNFPGARDAVFSPDGSEVWVASARQLTRWTRDGGTADRLLTARRSDGPAAFAPDGSVLATYTGQKDDRLTLWRLPVVEEIAHWESRLPEARFRALAAGGTWYALADPGSQRKRLVVYDGRSGRERFSRDFEEPVHGLASLPDGRTLAVGVSEPGRARPNAIALLDANTGERLGSLPIPKRGVTAMTAAPKGSYLAVGFNGLVQVWDVNTRELLRSITGFERVVTCLAFTPDHGRLAGGTQDGQVWVWSVPDGRAVQRIEVGSRVVRSVAFSPDGRQLVTVATNAAPAVSVWNTPAVSPADVQ